MKRIIIIFMFALFLISFVSASEFVFKQGTERDLQVPCIIDDKYCSLSSLCELTIINQETGNVVVNNSLMTPNTHYHNYTLNTSDTSINGIYTRNVQCCDGALCGYGSDTFIITPTGNKLTVASSIGYGLMLFIMFSVCIFFLIFSRMTENPGIKLFLIMVGFAMLLLTIGAGIITAQSFDIQSNATGLFTGLLFLTTMIFIVIMFYIFIQQTRRALQLMQARKGFIDEEDIDF